ncbi:hypothetical protein [Spiroplasma gladiatoris]|nr:hypothetical protein [Spiroplasma gladiatoris]
MDKAYNDNENIIKNIILDLIKNKFPNFKNPNLDLFTFKFEKK